MVEKKDWFLTAAASRFDDDFIHMDNEIYADHYKLIYADAPKGRTLLYYGDPNYEKPPLSELCIPARLLKKKQDLDNSTLDELDEKPVFNVLSPRQSQCLPFAARDTLKKYGLYEKVVEQNPLYIEDDKDDHLNSDQKLSNHSSTEHLTNGENLCEDDDSARPLYKGDPIMYRKQMDNDTISQKNVNGKKAKKSKQQRKPQNVIHLEEKHDYINDIVQCPTRKLFSINIAKCNDSNSEINETNIDPPYLEFVSSHLHAQDKKESLYDLDDFPTLALSESSAPKTGEVEQPQEHGSLWEIEDSDDGVQLSEDIVVIENLPKDLSEKELNDFLFTFGRIESIEKFEENETLTVHFKFHKDANWLVECINGQNVFEECERLRCYIKS